MTAEMSGPRPLPAQPVHASESDDAILNHLAKYIRDKKATLPQMRKLLMQAYNLTVTPAVRAAAVRNPSAESKS